MRKKYILVDEKRLGEIRSDSGCLSWNEYSFSSRPDTTVDFFSRGFLVLLEDLIRDNSNFVMNIIRVRIRSNGKIASQCLHVELSAHLSSW